jgi:hypothetical protein
MRGWEGAQFAVANETLRVGDKVLWLRSWGQGIEQEARVTHIDSTQNGEKYGIPVDDVRWGEEFVVILDNGHWAYSYQVAPAEVES